jgi:hypothetical protein
MFSLPITFHSNSVCCFRAKKGNLVNEIKNFPLKKKADIRTFSVICFHSLPLVAADGFSIHLTFIYIYISI